jgi:elongation factor G
MKVYETKNIRNVALLGHAGSGKTLLSDTILFKAGAINRRGSIEDRNTVSDYHEIEHERGNSIYMTPLVSEYRDTKINLLDSPGFDDFVGQTISAIRAAETAFILINSTNTLEVGVELATTNSEKDNTPMVFAVNRLDVENTKFDERVSELQDQFGKKAAVIQFPVNPGAGFNSVVDLLKMKMFVYDSNGNSTQSDIPADLASKAESLRGELVESIAETNDDLMNKFFE